tara:strand:+ start:869 stop:1360 length:492 start_codon:yes stop_codon:yes gene_type:complete
MFNPDNWQMAQGLEVTERLDNELEERRNFQDQAKNMGFDRDQAFRMWQQRQLAKGEDPIPPGERREEWQMNKGPGFEVQQEQGLLEQKGIAAQERFANARPGVSLQGFQRANEQTVDQIPTGAIELEQWGHERAARHKQGIDARAARHRQGIAAREAQWAKFH